ncbi:hypothetical protein C8Q80DRAFT_322926 [Daedaleopsis nitida]|nr:hypothetical protein C8Q80DRAFT_440356 [Daedaleopsis nitida]KAI0737432.1 hypothetical protein C8Q80DRAFT_322926 [Daedaleopsis nitida]
MCVYALEQLLRLRGAHGPRGLCLRVAFRLDSLLEHGCGHPISPARHHHRHHPLPSRETTPPIPDDGLELQHARSPSHLHLPTYLVCRSCTRKLGSTRLFPHVSQFVFTTKSFPRHAFCPGPAPVNVTPYPPPCHPITAILPYPLPLNGQIYRSCVCTDVRRCPASLTSSSSSSRSREGSVVQERWVACAGGSFASATSQPAYESDLKQSADRRRTAASTPTSFRACVRPRLVDSTPRSVSTAPLPRTAT